MAGSILMQRCAWSTDNAVQPTDQEPIGPRAMASTRDATDLTACGASTQPGMQMLVASRRDPLRDADRLRRHGVDCVAGGSACGTGCAARFAA
ncbi:MAG: hypothetical protein JWQ26_3293 [Modestobacter sp.]|jgi:hypothetical protein|nr:hypothetical protein [Modestobacter sp.]